MRNCFLYDRKELVIKYLDAHTHAHFPAYDKDRGAVMARAREAGVAMVTVGTTRRTSEDAVALAEAHHDVYATIGIHPSHASAGFWDVGELGSSEEARRVAKEGEAFDAAAFRTLAAHPKVVAIGECGFDYNRLPEDATATKEAQERLFVAQMELALEVGKPLMIHCREAMADFVALVTRKRNFLNQDNPGIMHFFSGTLKEARALLAFGFSFTFGGVTTFACDYDEVIRAIPADRIFAETDAPYVAPVPHRGKRNEPVYIVEVYRKLAEIRGENPEAFRAQVNRNAERIFGISLGS
jgi:TatD DNase family protein